MLSDDESARLRALEENLVREDPKLATHFDRPAVSLWQFLLLVVGSLAGTAMIIVGAVYGWTPLAWIGVAVAVGVPVAHHQRTRRRR